VAALPDGRRLEVKVIADLRRAFTELQEAADAKRASVSVALVPPLVQVRHIALPPLREAERRRVLERDAGRYFVGLGEPHVVGSVVLTRRTIPVSVFVAAAPARLIEEIEAAVSAAGWVLAAIVPAQSAWAAAGDGLALVRLAHVTELLHVKRGRVLERRRFRPGDPVPPDLSDAFVIEDPVASAAMNAPVAFEPDFCSESRYAMRQRRARRAASAMVGVALVCTVLTAAVDYWGLSRELTAVRERRAELRPRVAAAMQTRDSLAALGGNLATLGTLERTTVRWSSFLADLGDYLPRDAHVVALRGVRDSIVVEGVAGRAIGVFQALQYVPRVTGVRAETPIRQDIASDGTVREQFALSVRLVEMQ
jgi:hypothetical protein